MTPPPPETHDLLRAADTLRQCLGQDKRPLAVFLGAGCPLAIQVRSNGESRPLIPDIADLTAAILAQLSAGALADALNELVKGLVEDSGQEPNVEDWLTRLRSLAAIAGDSTVRGLTAQTIKELEAAITAAIFSIVSVNLPAKAGAYDGLSAWAGSVVRSHPLTIFTTNYDLLVEQALERHGFAYFDGFVGSSAPFLDTRAMEDDVLPSRWARLWKLHGSVNWARLLNGGVVRRAPQGAEEQHLIHPSHLKYEESRRMPYLAMHDRFRAFLKQASATLVTVGYSFGDDHINELIVEGLRGNSSAVVFGLLYGQMNGYPAASTLASRCANLTLLATDSGYIGTRMAPWAGVDAAEAAQSPTRCDLGDFASFADLLGQLTGIGGSSEDRHRV